MNENNKKQELYRTSKEGRTEEGRGEGGRGGGKSKCKRDRDDTKAGVLEACSGSLDGVLGWDGMGWDGMGWDAI